jgi:hypothetical protein
MAPHQGDESLKHPSVAKFGTVDGASKNATKTDAASVSQGTQGGSK